MTGILIAPLRPAPLLAASASTLQALSSGRLVLGVSTSWQAEEYAALGVPFSERGQVLEDTLRACRRMWANPDAVPIWFGGKFTPRLVRRVVTLGQGWIPFQGYNESLTEVGEKAQLLREAMAEAGRDPRELQVAYWMRTFGRSLPDVVDDIPAMAEAGVTVGELLFTSYMQEPKDAPRVLEEIARCLDSRVAV
jgi:alkanesulfonate monooxygenase SsuD/methylene tetrahydromethanopterin reductase-like flavin-dependent oxidoreductase (luciferase family)